MTAPMLISLFLPVKFEAVFAKIVHLTFVDDHDFLARCISMLCAS